MRATEIDELVAIAAERDLVLMPGHLLLYHPGVRKLKELIDAGELGEVLCVYGNRQNLGIVRTNENALWSLGVHDLSVILYLLDEEPAEAIAHGRDFLTEGVEDVVFCYLRFPSGKIAHMHLSWLDPHKMRRITVVGREKMVVFDDMELERKVTVYEKAPWKRAETYGEWQTRSGDIYIPKIATRRAAEARMPGVPAADRGNGDRRKVAEDGARVVRALEHAADASSTLRTGCRCRSGSNPRRDVYPGTVLGDGVRVLENAVVGKQPALGPKSTAKREPLPPAVIGDGTIVSTGAIVFAGATIGSACILGDQSCVRERVTIARRRRRRPRLARRERHDDRQRDAHPGGRVHHRVLDSRGRRLHRAVRRHDERQLHGPHGAAEGADARARRSGAARGSAAARSSGRRSRSAKRRSSVRAPS